MLTLSNAAYLGVVNLFRGLCLLPIRNLKVREASLCSINRCETLWLSQSLSIACRHNLSSCNETEAPMLGLPCCMSLSRHPQPSCVHLRCSLQHVTAGSSSTQLFWSLAVGMVVHGLYMQPAALMHPATVYSSSTQLFRSLVQLLWPLAHRTVVQR